MREVECACASFCGLSKNQNECQQKSCGGLEGQKSYRALCVSLECQCGGLRLPVRSISGGHSGDLIGLYPTNIRKE
jgi:hypothetical protein